MIVVHIKDQSESSTEKGLLLHFLVVSLYITNRSLIV